MTFSLRPTLALGASVNGGATTLTTPLMAAVYGDDHVAADWLLRKGANVDDRPRPAGEFADTPLMVAAEDGMRRVLPVLLRYGARVDARNRDGFTALHFARRFCGPWRSDDS